MINNLFGKFKKFFGLINTNDETDADAKNKRLKFIHSNTNNVGIKNLNESIASRLADRFSSTSTQSDQQSSQLTHLNVENGSFENEITIDVHQVVKFIVVSNLTEQSVITETTNVMRTLVQDMVNNFKNMLVTDLKQQVEKTRQHSMISDLLASLCGSNDDDNYDQTATIGQQIEKDTQIANAFDTEMRTINQDVVSSVSKKDVFSKLASVMLQQANINLKGVNASKLNVNIVQDINVFKNIVMQLDLAETFQSTINSSETFHLQLDSSSQETGKIDTSSIDTEQHESFSDMLNAFVKPAIVIAAILALVIIFYILLKILR